MLCVVPGGGGNGGKEEGLNGTFALREFMITCADSLYFGSYRSRSE